MAILRLPRWSLPKSQKAQDSFAPEFSYLLAGDDPGQLLEEKVQVEPDPIDSVRVAVQRLAKLGLKPSQIRRLRQIEYLNALHYLADTDEDELDEAWDMLRSRPSQISSRHDSLRLSYRSSSRYPSGVSSLISDQSSLRDSTATTFSFPVDDGNVGNTEHVGDPTQAPLYWKLSSR